MAVQSAFTSAKPFKPVKTSSKPSMPSTQELSDADRHTLAFRLAALAIVTYLARFLIGLVKYVLDAALLLLLITSVAAVISPSAKNSTLTQLLVQVESFVSPVFSVVAERGASVVLGPAKTVAQFLGIGPDSSRA
ncbi:hypothetical protein LPJ78_002271 [Coemansia sp. RSA 989]|nr:hypothetical protein BX667DRAFT_506647 [Coemansia mojavensis]KAJ1742641.1 hypothetical protein LPJ68_001703 [Coemansia sp. RSA 1086]KAJ1751401.1 hypothetical protein LPJ79_002079 [Coemansia sp. RSA 1821]KAJ1865968.1 hypothetical protein LPJ78_002271 [Coemansia sp. RSA 989]KAJ1873150.1 hypothetical protein LPJ55_002508 [Coemansia sp. RSA 990]KAJ2632346.1 hypothetical protein H4R22_001341 [Coemansia sp. RSA 1290]KAJ2651836.1 hypothetical protein IWW40_001384 [Coemansia sp. RSA 1250]KAJ26748